ncbi:hypothetical protein [Aquimarina mytili]|uniref:Uncharacterized protein n=1 Tax=Aquimarina mytili TaxID=874423 RepID=A0A936ZWV0_9FLAO|nr:hypothetical protein [Aquimarina mytili]MBL0683430.1 hypothetical protein [Aquimarina mytili]
MKNNHIFLILFILICQTGFSQLFHFHINNNDGPTRRKLGQLILTLTSKNTALGITNAALNNALISHRNHLRKNYSRNSFDRKDNFLLNSAGSATLSLGTSVLSRYPKLPYMTKTKRDYIEAITMDKAILLGLQYIDARKVKSGRRQEIYRLRGELIREFSKNDKEARKILLFSAAGWSIVNYATFSEMIRTLKAVETTF